jgi:hypothetical protein
MAEVTVNSGIENVTIGIEAVAHTHLINDVTDITATATELNILDGATITTTELNYVDGVTSAIQTQLSGKANVNHKHYEEGIQNISFTSGSSTGSVTFSETITPAPNVIASISGGASSTGKIYSVLIYNVISTGFNYQVFEMKNDSGTIKIETSNSTSVKLSWIAV